MGKEEFAEKLKSLLAEHNVQTYLFVGEVLDEKGEIDGVTIADDKDKDVDTIVGAVSRACLNSTVFADMLIQGLTKAGVKLKPPTVH